MKGEKYCIGVPFSEQNTISQINSACSEQDRGINQFWHEGTLVKRKAEDSYREHWKITYRIFRTFLGLDGSFR